MTIDYLPLQQVFADNSASGFLFRLDETPFAQLDLFKEFFTLVWLTDGSIPEMLVIQRFMSAATNSTGSNISQQGELRATIATSKGTEVIETKQGEAWSPYLDLCLARVFSLDTSQELMSFDLETTRYAPFSSVPFKGLWIETYRRSEYPEICVTLDYSSDVTNAIRGLLDSCAPFAQFAKKNDLAYFWTHVEKALS